MKLFGCVLAATLALGPSPLKAAVPTLQSLVPPAGTVSNLTRVQVTFSATINGPAPEDLLINGNPASAVTGISNIWTFTFSQPPPGPVALSWDGSHAIFDLSGNRFDELAPGSTWTYTLLDTIAPAILSIAPTPGAVVDQLTAIEVVFREPVTGVNATDLLLGGQPAAAVVGAGVGPYVFSFAQPSAASVQVTWADGQAIDDAATPPNRFAGGSWSYTLEPESGPDVVLNEIMADNLNGLLDENGDTSDWIELLNRGPASVNLLGWSLSDDPLSPGQWVFPSVTLQPGQFLVVFASGKDRAPGGTGTNHANFTLGPSEFLGLYNARFPRQVVSTFAPYPEQRGDIAWGHTGSEVTYFSNATPRSANSSPVHYTGFTERPEASVDSGLFAQGFHVTLSSPTAGALIYYTLNGDAPTPTQGILYASPIRIEGTLTKGSIPLRAAAYQTGLLPSAILTRSYIFPDHVLRQPSVPPGYPSSWISGGGLTTTVGDYQMDPQVLTNGANRSIARQGLTELPVVSLVTDINTLFAPATGVYTARRKQGNQRAVNAEMWLPNGQRVFQADCGFEVQGGSSPGDSGSDWKDKKLSLRLIFKGDFGTTKLEAKVFDDTPVAEFDTLILDAGLNYWWTHMGDSDQRNRAKFITDQFTSDLMNNAGLVAQHGRYVHLYLNGLYWGLYNLHERMDEAAAASYLGGEKEQWDILKHTGDVSGLQNGTVTNYTAMFQVARLSGLATNLANYERLQGFLDVPWLIDYLIINFYVGNTDWPNHNWYAWRRSRVPGSLPWRFISWDAEHTVKSYVENRLSIGDPSSPGELFQVLRNNPEFKLLFADRVHRLMYNGGALYSLPNRVAFWSPTNPAANIPATTYRKRVDEIWNSVVCESARWGDVANENINNPYTRELHYTRELNSLFSLTNAGGQTANYFPLRGSNVLAQFRTAGLYPNVAAPVFSQHGGRVAPGHPLFITNAHASGTIYYTTNGADPRSYGSGVPAPGVATYAGEALAITGSMTVKARTRAGTVWSALNEATFTAGSLGVPLRITELMFDPPGGPAHEFIELWNMSPTDLTLTGYFFQGITFSFAPGFVLPAGARIILASDRNPVSFAARYPGVPVAGYFAGSLDNAGERIAVLDVAGNIVISIDYDDENGWPAPAAGGGYSLELLDPNGNPDDPANWRASATLNGSPGLPPATQAVPDIRINEVMADNRTTTNLAGTFPDWIEIVNAGSSAVDLTGWSLSDNSDPRRFVFRTGPVLASGAYLIVFFDSPPDSVPGLHSGFALDKEGGRLLLYGPATNRVDAMSFGVQLPDYSVGRVAGLWQLNLPTPGGANTTAATAPATALALNEWMANAPPAGSDWIELHNRSATLPASLQGIYLGTAQALFRHTWLSFIAPGGFLQLFADETPGPTHLDFKLPAAGGQIVLHDAAGIELERISYGAQTEGVTQGRFPDGSESILSFPGSATPGASNQAVSYSGPLLNELLARNRTGVVTPWGARADWVELVNPTDAPVDLGGLGLSDRPGTPRWLLPGGTFVGPHGFLRIWCDDEAPPSHATSPDLNTGFALSATSGGLYLFGVRGAVVDYVEHGFQADDRSIGRSQDGVWRLLASPTPAAANSGPASLGNPSSLRFNEWLTASEAGADWFELYNPDAQPVVLSGLYLTDNPSVYGTMQFQVGPLSFIGGHGYVVFEADAEPGQGPEHVNFRLDRSGGALRLYDDTFTLIDAVDFGAQEPGISTGRLPDGASQTSSLPGSSTPGESNYHELPNAVINEVLVVPEPTGPMEDAIEIYNPTGSGVAVGGWFLSNDPRDPKKYRIPDGTLLEAGGYRVFYLNQFGSGPAAFQLPRAGGQVMLSEADPAGNLSGYRAVARFGAATPGVSFGRVEGCLGTDFAPMQRPTLGVENPSGLAQFRTGAGLNNSDPIVGPIVISEVMYDPDGGPGADDSEYEYIELHNITGQAVPLFDPARPTKTWRLREGVQFTFPTGATIPAGGFALVVSFDPANDDAQLGAFLSWFDVPEAARLYGPYSGRLGNDGETIELLRPQERDAASGLVPFATVDRLTYGVGGLWPTNANGAGLSLQRRWMAEHGNDPANWLAGARTTGQPTTTPPAPARAPSVVIQPLSRTVLLGSRVVFSASICGSRPLNYQWKRDGTVLPGATAGSLVLESVQSTDAASYSVEISNVAGTVTSLPAVLGLGNLPQIQTQPQPQTARVGESVEFGVQVAGDGPFTFQWRRNGHPLPGASGPALTVADLGPADAGDYTVVVGNAVGTVVSAAAPLRVLVPPTITLQPQSQSVATNGTATLTVAASGVGVLRYQWWFNGASLPDATAASLVITNARLANEGEYRVVVTDDVTFGLSDVARLTVRVPPVIVRAPVGQTNVVGSTMTFVATATGSVPMAFRWSKTTTPIVRVTNILHSTSNAFTITNAQTSHSGLYQLTVTNSGNLLGVTVSFTVLVVAPPVITNQPLSRVAHVGESVRFSAGVGGTAPLAYRWLFLGNELAGATNSSLTLTNVQLADQGAYQLMVTNLAGQASSQPATLTLVGPPALQHLQRLADGTVRMGLTGLPTRSYTIEVSPNLRSWTTLTTVVYSDGVVPVTDPGAVNVSNRFYRARLLP